MSWWNWKFNDKEEVLQEPRKIVIHKGMATSGRPQPSSLSHLVLERISAWFLPESRAWDRSLSAGSWGGARLELHWVIYSSFSFLLVTWVWFWLAHDPGWFCWFGPPAVWALTGWHKGGKTCTSIRDVVLYRVSCFLPPRAWSCEGFELALWLFSFSFDSGSYQSSNSFFVQERENSVYWR